LITLNLTKQGCSNSPGTRETLAPTRGIFERLFREAEIAKLDPKEMEEYQKSLKDYWDEYANITTAKEEGRQEEKQEIARQMKQRGLEVELIASITGLSREEVERL
jgi:predicted transposase/invertase (TIGR01784 family)